MGMILFKVWLAGVISICLIITVYCIFWLCYDWRWYFKNELPPRSVSREVRRLVKIRALKDPVEMDVEIMKDEEGNIWGAILKFVGGNTRCMPEVAFCRNIRGNLDVTQQFWRADIIYIILWPVMMVALLVDMVNERLRRQAKN